jgi:plastocyanin
MGIVGKRVAAAALATGLALGGAALAGVGAQAQRAVPTVTVGLKEFRLLPSTKKLHTGKVILVAVNRGKFPHALEIKGPGVQAKTAMLRPGQSKRLTVTLRKGTYSLWCPVSNHAEMGMRMTLKVSAGTATSTGMPAPTSSSTPTTTTTDDGGGGYSY